MYTLAAGKSGVAGWFGNSFDSFFQVHRESGRVVFNVADGIFIGKIGDGSTSSLEDGSGLREVKIAEVSYGCIPFWIDEHTIGYAEPSAVGAHIVRVKVAEL